VAPERGRGRRGKAIPSKKLGGHDPHLRAHWPFPQPGESSPSLLFASVKSVKFSPLPHPARKFFWELLKMVVEIFINFCTTHPQKRCGAPEQDNTCK